MSSRLEKRSELNDQLLESVGKGEAKGWPRGVSYIKMGMGMGGVHIICIYIYISMNVVRFPYIDTQVLI